LTRNGTSIWGLVFCASFGKFLKHRTLIHFYKSAYSISNSSWFHKMSKNHLYLAIGIISPCIQLSPETLTLLDFGAVREYLLVLDPNVLYTPHAWTLPWLRYFLHLGFNSYYLWAPLTWSIIATRPPMSDVNIWCWFLRSGKYKTYVINIWTITKYHERIHKEKELTKQAWN